MAAINANIVVDQTNVILNPTTNSIGVTVDPINLGVYTGGVSNVVPGGTPGQLQYNLANTTFAGVANTSVASNGTVTFQNLANLKIAGGSSGYQLSTDGAGVLSWTDATSNANYANFANVANNLNATTTSNVVIGGGTNGYFLQTDGAGALTWNAGTTTPGSANPGGANTQIQYNDAGSFGGTAGFTFNEVTGNVDIPGIYNGDGGGLSNITATVTEIANGTSNVKIATVDGNIDLAVGGSDVARFSTTGAAYPAVFTVQGNINAFNDITAEPGALFVGDGGGLSNIAAGNVVGSFTDLTTANLNVTNTTSIYQGIEDVQLIGAQTGTYNFDMLNGSIQYSTANAAANIFLNFRGNSSTTANAFLANSKSVTSTYVLSTGATAYSITGVQVDGVTQTVDYVNGVTPTSFSNAKNSYTFTIIKTSTTPTYTVLSSMTPYF